MRPGLRLPHGRSGKKGMGRELADIVRLARAVVSFMFLNYNNDNGSQ